MRFEILALGSLLVACGDPAGHQALANGGSTSGGGNSGTGGGVSGAAGSVAGGAGGTSSAGSGGSTVSAGGSVSTAGTDGGPLGGSGGTGPTHVVTACLGLGEGGDSGEIAVGEWADVTPPEVSVDGSFNGFNTGIGNFVIDPTNTATVYMGTCTQGLYKTTDCGASWEKINTGTNGEMVDGGRIWSMAIDPIDSQVLYVDPGYGVNGLLKSTDGGVSWEQLFTAESPVLDDGFNAFLEFVAIDPTNHEHLVVSSHGECTGAVAGPTCMAESTDSGASWKAIKIDPPVGYEAVGHLLIDTTTWLILSPFAGVSLTTNQGDTWSYSYLGNTSNQSGELYRQDDGTYFLPGYYGIAKSTDAGITWTAVPGTPRSFSMAGDGATAFTSVQDENQDVVYWTSSGDLTEWEPYPSPKISKGSWVMRYDRDHSLLYSSNETGGFWRVRTK